MTPGLAAALADAASLVEADGGGAAATTAPPPPPGRAPPIDGVAALRRACLDLLAAALAWPPFRDSGEADVAAVRDRAVTAFFAQLTSPVAGDAAVAEAGLAAVAGGPALPKALLQAGLRPVLVNVAYPEKLRTPLLRGLARLLALLAPWFNATLGDKLVDHLRRWLAPPGGAGAAAPPLPGEGPGLPPGDGARVAAAVLDLFHRLPPAASKFLASSDRPGLVVLTIDLEAALAATPGNAAPTVLTSPYRAPLLRYACAHADAAASYFLTPARVAARPYYDRFLALLAMEGADALVDAVCGSTDALVALLEPPPSDGGGDAAAAATPAATPHPADDAAMPDAGGGGEGEGGDAPPPPPPPARRPPPPPPNAAVVRAHGVRLLALLARLRPGWLPDPLFDAVMRLWRSPAIAESLEGGATAARDALREPARVAAIVVARARAAPAATLPSLFDVCDAFTVRSRVDHGFLARYLARELPGSLDTDARTAAIAAFVDAARSHSRPPASLAAVAAHIVLPLLQACVDDGTLAVVLPDAQLASLVALMAAPDAAPPPSPASDALDAELLRAATLLIRASPDRLVDRRKELIKFGWHHLKRDDGGARGAAFLAVSTFLDAYATPDKVSLQVFVALLRTSQADGGGGGGGGGPRSTAARDALDVLTPALVRRLPAPAGAGFPVWMGYVKKVLDEEAHSATHAAHVWGVVARHGPLFYGARGLFVPAAVAALGRLGLSQSSPLDSRKLALDLAALVVAWEAQRRGEGGRAGAGASDAPAPPPPRHRRAQAPAVGVAPAP